MLKMSNYSATERNTQRNIGAIDMREVLLDNWSGYILEIVTSCPHYPDTSRSPILREFLWLLFMRNLVEYQKQWTQRFVITKTYLQKKNLYSIEQQVYFYS